MRYVATETVPVDALEAYPGNARVHDEPALDESARTNGQYRSVVARRLEGGSLQLLAGHGTVGAFRRQGAGEVRVEVIEADDTEARRIVLADNGTSRGASYDESLLLDLLDAASKDGGLGGTGWDGEAYKELLDAADEGNPFDFDPNGDADDFDEEPPEEPVTQPGDVWVLGPHRLVCGDSTDEQVWTDLTHGHRMDAVWTDPPYGVAVVGGSRAESVEDRRKAGGLEIKNDALDIPALTRFLAASLGAALRSSKPGAAWYVASPTKQPMHAFTSVLTDLGVWRSTIVWVKDAFVLGRGDYHSRHEVIFYGWTPGTARMNPVEDRTQDDVWEIPRPKRNEDHPTMKPVELVARALRNSTDRGCVVADPFGGSGTTLVAAHTEGRIARLIEVDPRYCDVIARRYQDLTGDLPVLERTGERFDFHGADGPVAVAA